MQTRDQSSSTLSHASVTEAGRKTRCATVDLLLQGLLGICDVVQVRRPGLLSTEASAWHGGSNPSERLGTAHLERHKRWVLLDLVSLLDERCDVLAFRQDNRAVNVDGHALTLVLNRCVIDSFVRSIVGRVTMVTVVAVGGGHVGMETVIGIPVPVKHILSLVNSIRVPVDGVPVVLLVNHILAVSVVNRDAIGPDTMFLQVAGGVNLLQCSVDVLSKLGIVARVSKGEVIADESELVLNLFKVVVRMVALTIKVVVVSNALFLLLEEVHQVVRIFDRMFAEVGLTPLYIADSGAKHLSNWSGGIEMRCRKFWSKMS